MANSLDLGSQGRGGAVGEEKGGDWGGGGGVRSGSSVSVGGLDRVNERQGEGAIGVRGEG